MPQNPPQNPMQKLHDAGQSIWLDSIDRTMLRDGALRRRVDDEAVTGVTSNPTIFEKALAGPAYDAAVASAPAELSAAALFERLATDDVRSACDILRGVHDDTHGADGFVSIEVSPGVARSEDATAAEARRLWDTVGRPNLMVKIPGTPEGARAVRRSIADGLNINITLLFALEAYRSVSEAYMSGLEDRLSRGEPIDTVHSVASFFVSRVDTEVDGRIDAILPLVDGAAKLELAELRGKAAVANARLAYEIFQKTLASKRWKALADRGATVQRPLWASVGTKNPAYRDVVYVEQLIGPDTVSTMPAQTITAFRDHGIVRRAADEDFASARAVLAGLERRGISLDAVTEKLLADGLASFATSYDSALAGLEKKRRSLRTA